MSVRNGIETFLIVWLLGKIFTLFSFLTSFLFLRLTVQQPEPVGSPGVRHTRFVQRPLSVRRPVGISASQRASHSLPRSQVQFLGHIFCFVLSDSVFESIVLEVYSIFLLKY